MSSATRLPLFLLSLVASCHSYSIFETTCSTPSNPVNFVSSPDSRGTLDILWSCLFTIVACTWTIQHLNVPEQRKCRKEGHGLWCDFKWTLKEFWRALKWMVFTMLAPEFILGKALGDLAAAYQCQERMRDFAREDKVEWGLAHGFYAGMGGFVGVFEDETQDKEDQMNKTTKLVYLTAQTIYWLRKTERVSTNTPILEEGATESQNKKRTRIDSLPDITFAELRDKSKGDIFVKAIAIIQVFWVALQIIVRAAKGLAISQLELAVAAFSACAIITYLILIRKPQGVRVPSRPIAVDSRSIKEANDQGEDDLWLRVMFIPGLISFEEPAYVPNDRLDLGFDVNGKKTGMIESEIFQYCLVGFTVGGVIFGSVHVAGWNLSFPTQIEQILWRISSVLITVLLPIVFLPVFLCFVFRKFKEFLQEHSFLLQIWDLVFGVLYIAARLFLLVEIFRTLLYLSPNAYISTWASNIPHVA